MKYVRKKRYIGKKGLYVLTALGIGFLVAFIVFFIHRGSTDQNTATDFIGNVQMKTIDRFQDTFSFTIYSKLALYYALSQAIHETVQNGGRSAHLYECPRYNGRVVWNADDGSCYPTKESLKQGMSEYLFSSLQYYLSFYSDIQIPLYSLSEPTFSFAERVLEVEMHLRKPVTFPIVLSSDDQSLEEYQDAQTYYDTIDLYKIGAFVWPLKAGQLDNFVITSLFGERDIKESQATDHKGVDIRARPGEPVYAIASGTVVRVGGSSDPLSFGEVILSHENGFESRYLHCYSPFVEENDVVEQGDPLCLVGGTGRGSLNEFAPHLHLEIRQDEEAIDPLLYFTTLDFHFTQDTLHQLALSENSYSYEQTIRQNQI